MSIASISTSMHSIAKILKQQHICGDTKPLTDTASELNKTKKKCRCHYKLKRLIFKPPSLPRNPIPKDTKNLRIILDLEICEVFGEQRNIFNPIHVDKQSKIYYNCSITAKGKVKNVNDEDDPIEVISSIHLDFDNINDSDFIHPDFHMTFGGKSMTDYFEGEDNSEIFGRALLLTSPRLSHPPMDAILSIDFILRNFFKKEQCDKIFSDSKYRNAVRQSQERLWKPYMLALAGHWCKFNGCNYSDTDCLAQKYHPSLIK